MSKGKKKGNTEKKDDSKKKVDAAAVAEPEAKVTEPETAPENEAETTEIPTKVLYVETRFRQFLKAHGVNLGADIWEKADQVFRSMLVSAVERAKANGRKTLRAIDF